MKFGQIGILFFIFLTAVVLLLLISAAIYGAFFDNTSQRFREYCESTGAKPYYLRDNYACEMPDGTLRTWKR